MRNILVQSSSVTSKHCLVSFWRQTSKSSKTIRHPAVHLWAPVVPCTAHVVFSPNSREFHSVCLTTLLCLLSLRRCMSKAPRGDLSNRQTLCSTDILSSTRTHPEPLRQNVKNAKSSLLIYLWPLAF